MLYLLLEIVVGDIMFKKYKNYIFIICVSLFIILSYVIIHQDFQLQNSILVNDLSTQYASLITYFKNCLLRNDSFFYSFSKGIGGNMASTIAYYLTSPLNVFCLLFKNLNVAIMISIICRFCLANITMYIFLKDKSDKKHCLLFSTIYAFSGYMVLYYFNVMWIDVVIIAPIILKFVDKLILGKFYIILPILLAISLILNYYISYMLFIFIVIYTIYELCLKYSIRSEKEKILKILALLFLSFIFAFCLSGWVILPSIFDMKDNMFRYATNDNILDFDFSRIFMVIARMFVGTYDSTTRFNFNEVNIYITVFGLVLIIKYFLNKEIAKKEKILSFFIILVFVFSIVFNLFNLAWHGFSFPNGYNYRFSFVFCLFFIMVACKQYSCNQRLSLKYLGIIILAFLIISICLVGKYSYLSNASIIITFVLFVVYLLLLNTNKFRYFLIFIVFFEILLNFNLCFYTGKGLEYNDEVYDYKDDICAEIQDLSGNYRVSLQNVISSDDGFLCNIKDVGVTLTTNNTLYYEFMHHIGYSVTYSTITKNIFAGPFIDSILGVKRTLRINENYELYYNLLDIKSLDYDNYSIFLYSHNNKEALSLGYIIDDSNINYTDNPFENQNELAKRMSGLDLDIFEPVEMNRLDPLTYEYSMDKSYYYIYNYFPIPINLEHYISLYVNDFRIDSLQSFHKGILFVQNSSINTTSTLKIEMQDEKYRQYVNPLVYTFNYENYCLIMEKLQSKQMEISYFEKNKIIGDIYLDEASTLMITVPYEKGWNIKVNGKKVDYSSAYDMFLTINLDEGNYHIEMEFIPPKFIEGIILSIFGFIVLIIVGGKLKCIKI